MGEHSVPCLGLVILIMWAGKEWGEVGRLTLKPEKKPHYRNKMGACPLDLEKVVPRSHGRVGCSSGDPQENFNLRPKGIGLRPK